MPLFAGTRLGPYEILAPLGAGGMGEVYRSKDTKLDREVALKVLPDALAQDPERLARFEREAKVLASLNHPNIAQIYGVEDSGGVRALVMELVPGQTLSSLMKTRSLPLSTALSYAKQIAEALEAAHGKGITHRDLKPANIMVTQFGAKVLDFGLAQISVPKQTGDDTVTLTTVAGTILGTPYYMSPEQASGEKTDGRSDLFSLGVVLYEMTTGVRPFTGKGAPSILAAVLKENPVSPSQRCPQLPARLDEIVGKALEKDRDLRYQSAKEMSAACQQLQRELEVGLLELPASAKRQAVRSLRMQRNIVGVVAILTIAIGLAIWLMTDHKVHALSATDTVVLADLTNRTGDAVFEDTLKEALSAELTQSPFLSILPEPKVAATLKLMQRPKNAPLSNDTAREVCLRAGSRAYISGSIARLGSQYVIVLQAIECQNADVIARTQATADAKEQVLRALDYAGKLLRQKVGESLASVEKFGTPLNEVTTPSLEALKAYTMGRKAMFTGDQIGAIALFQWAIGQDPNFAMAILSLGLCQFGLSETASAEANFRRAYDLRDRIGEWERFAIESRYYLSVMGDLERARQVYATWAKTYPRESIAISNLGAIESNLGHHERAIEYNREAILLAPNLSNIEGLAGSYLSLDRLDDAKSLLEKAGTEDDNIHFELYKLAFLRNDSAEMSQQVAWSAGKAAVEDEFLFAEAETAAYSGRVGAARQFVRRAVTLAQQADEKEVAANYEALAAIREALFGYRTEAHLLAAAALKTSNARDLEYGAALALAEAGDTRRAEALADDLAKRYQSDTIVQFICLPAIRGRVAIDRKDYTKAIEILQVAGPYELGYATTLTNSIYAAYVRAEAYLSGGRNGEAVAEFQKVLSHRGLVTNEPIGALARLNLARAYGGQHDIAKAKDNYENFLSLWKDADADIPILKEARAEYKKLK
jgi:serine/threonine protein kinase/tetratricopeptide (TPR) repeat protein